MPYLIKNDFAKVITTFDLDALTDSQDLVWQNAEVSALEEVKSYLRNRYDTSQEFDIQTHDQTGTYLQDDYVIIQTGVNQGVYKALQDVVADTVITDTAFWALDDPRNAKLITSVILIILYENYTRLNGSEIPNWLQIRYDGGDVKQMGGVIGYLKMIQKGTIEPNLPLRADVADGTSQTGNNIAFGVASDVVERNTSI
jgi:hypothetical protein